jgi:hypothetical protein
MHWSSGRSLKMQWLSISLVFRHTLNAPAALGEPVSSSTSQGTVITTMPLPILEAMFETCNITSGRLRLII